MQYITKLAKDYHPSRDKKMSAQSPSQEGCTSSKITIPASTVDDALTSPRTTTNTHTSRNDNYFNDNPNDSKINNEAGTAGVSSKNVLVNSSIVPDSTYY
mmetsp:Transcript_19347/g.24367  ORF Transcript_19347/g.24367 Transcript_19347/m.24367 type:complete len:100 (-) Transcript_19347:169-468(-)